MKTTYCFISRPRTQSEKLFNTYLREKKFRSSQLSQENSSSIDYMIDIDQIESNGEGKKINTLLNLRNRSK